MKRRRLIALAGGVIAGGPLVAQQAPARIGFMYSGSAASAAAKRVMGYLKQGLADNGLAEGRDYVLDVRYADGDYQRFPAMARELAQAGAKVILASTIPSVKAVQALVPPVPAVITVVLDPVGNGLIDSLAHPGHHTTGVGLLNADLTAKLLELQRAVLPKAKIVGALYNPASPAGLIALKKLQDQAGPFGFTVAPFALRLPQELDGVFAAIDKQRPDSLQVTQDAGILDLAPRICELAAKLKLPTFAESSSIPNSGGLLGYGPQYQPLFARAAYYAARIVRGANPDDLPVEQPALFELVVNLKTANTLGIEMPPAVVAQATTLIE
ncbi:MAG TPA: ABC transporter substrate-binding protein [Reyranella sp.]|jgi:putative ABC transport system substrate-binding protein|nr:ABC transporter substrate-binding protein [Reyranella sp.]